MEDILKIFGSKTYHDQVIIIGDKESLTKLKNAIEKTIENGNTSKFDSFESDGEGFDIFVKCETIENLDKLPLHYYKDYSPEVKYFNKNKFDFLFKLIGI